MSEFFFFNHEKEVLFFLSPQPTHPPSLSFFFFSFASLFSPFMHINVIV